MTTTTVPNRVQVLKTKFTTSLGLPFRDILPEWEIQQAIDELQIKYRRRLFDPFVTLWVFLSQMLDIDKKGSLKNKPSRVLNIVTEQERSSMTAGLIFLR